VSGHRLWISSTQSFTGYRLPQESAAISQHGRRRAESERTTGMMPRSSAGSADRWRSVLSRAPVPTGCNLTTVLSRVISVPQSRSC